MVHAEHVQVVLKKSLPHIGFEPGDAGVVVQVHNNGDAYEVEFFAYVWRHDCRDHRGIGLEGRQWERDRS